MNDDELFHLVGDFENDYMLKLQETTRNYYHMLQEKYNPEADDRKNMIILGRLSASCLSYAAYGFALVDAKDLMLLHAAEEYDKHFQHLLENADEVHEKLYLLKKRGKQ